MSINNPHNSKNTLNKAINRMLPTKSIQSILPSKKQVYVLSILITTVIIKVTLKHQAIHLFP